MILNHSPWGSRFALWHHFKHGAPIGSDLTERMAAGVLMQEPILRITAAAYRLKVESNKRNKYVVHPSMRGSRFGTRKIRLGHTRDGLMYAPDIGRVLVEAKNVDFFRWKDTWSETAAPPHIELQLQAGMMVDRAPKGIIAALVGGNDPRFYEREPHVPTQQRIADEIDAFFESLDRDEEPDPLGMPAELDILNHLYPEEALPLAAGDASDAKIGEIIRMFDWAREQESFHKKTKEQYQVLLLAAAQLPDKSGIAELLRGHGAEAAIKRISIEASLALKEDCGPVLVALYNYAIRRYGKEVNFRWPSEFRALHDLVTSEGGIYRTTRKASMQTRISVKKIDDPPLAEPTDNPMAA